MLLYYYICAINIRNLHNLSDISEEETMFEKTFQHLYTQPLTCFFVYFIMPLYVKSLKSTIIVYTL